MGSKQKRFTAEEKAKILRRHLVDRVAVSDLCEEHGISPAVFYRWQKKLFEGAPSVLERRSPKKEAKSEEKLRTLESKLQKKDEVIAELMEDHVKLKKEIGGP